MASYTPNLNLLMKDPVTDGADTFNIETMLNENWKKIDRQVLRAIAAAAAYDAGKTYQQGDFCTQGGLLYRANQAIAQPEAWTAGHWTAISITDVIRGLTAKDVGAAPDGYGLGTISTSISDFDDATKNGWYMNGAGGETVHAPDNIPGWFVFVSTYAENILIQTAYRIGTGVGIISAMRFLHSNLGGWNPWEYISPPMMLGVEYRTTERYGDKPVYKKAINFGMAPNTTYKEVSHGISNFSQLVSYSGMLGGANLIGHPFISSVHINGTSIRIETNTDASASNINVILSYIKTSD